MANVDLKDYRIGKKQVCVSMSVSDFVFMKNNGYSPTRLLRRAVENLRNEKSQDSLEEMYVKVEKLTKILQQQAQFIEDVGKSEQFGNYQDKISEQEIKAHKEKVKAKEAKENEEDVDKLMEKIV